MLRRLPGIAVLLLLAVAFVHPATAQDIGYTNQEALLANMPEYQQVTQQLQQEAASQQQEFQSEQQAFQQQVEQYQKQQGLLSEERRAEREQELQQMQQQLQQSAQQRDQRLQQREGELMQPLFEKLQGAIEQVAQTQNLDVVLRSQALLYVSEQSVTDITPDVASELGIELDQDTTAAAN